MYRGVLIAVRDMEKSKKFYQDIMQMDVVSDFGANVQQPSKSRNSFLTSAETSGIIHHVLRA